MQVNSFNHS